MGARKRKPRERTPEQIERKALLERLWAEGKTAAESCAGAGIVTSAPSAVISAYRSRGYDLPHRQDPKHVATSKRRRWNGRTNSAKARKARAA